MTTSRTDVRSASVAMGRALSAGFDVLNLAPVGFLASISARAGPDNPFQRSVPAMNSSAISPRRTLNAVSAICMPTLKLTSLVLATCWFRNT